MKRVKDFFAILTAETLDACICQPIVYDGDRAAAGAGAVDAKVSKVLSF